VKPFGAVAFGQLIDAYGRKKILLITTFLMTIATATIGLLPLNISNAYQWGALFGCRIIQGLSISGEFSTAIIMAVEQGGKRPAFFGSMAFVGGSMGLLFANFSIFLLLNFTPHEQMIQYGWRIPFLISTFFWLILFMIRNNIDDITPTKNLMREGMRDLVTSQKRALANVFIISSLSASAFYLTFIFMPTFLSATLSLHSHQTAVLITLICLVIYIIALPLGGLLADTIGVARQIKISAFLYLVFAYGSFAMITSLNSLGCLIVLILFAVIQALLNSALPAFMVTQFDQMQRGKALAISYNISLTLFGGLMPYLILTNGIHLNPGVPISICAALTLIIMHMGR